MTHVGPSQFSASRKVRTRNRSRIWYALVYSLLKRTGWSKESAKIDAISSGGVSSIDEANVGFFCCLDEGTPRLLRRPLSFQDFDACLLRLHVLFA